MVILFLTSALFCRPGNSTQPIWLKNFSCGTYSDRCFDTCTSCPLHAITSCSHFSDVTVQCGESDKHSLLHQSLLRALFPGSTYKTICTEAAWEQLRIAFKCLLIIIIPHLINCALTVYSRELLCSLHHILQTTTLAIPLV